MSATEWDSADIFPLTNADLYDRPFGSRETRRFDTFGIHV
jgi:hypothetical protein